MLRRPLEPKQYTSGDYQQALADAGTLASMGRIGTCWDNALAESFWAVLKNELIYTRAWPTRKTARTAIFDYIEGLSTTRTATPPGSRPSQHLSTQPGEDQVPRSAVVRAVPKIRRRHSTGGSCSSSVAEQLETMRTRKLQPVEPLLEQRRRVLEP